MIEVKGYVNAQVMLEMLEQYQGCYFPHSTAVHIVNKLVQTDVEPVRHGEWIHHHYDSGEYDLVDDKWYCSECHMCGEYRRSWYCPSCGAKMDGGN